MIKAHLISELPLGTRKYMYNEIMPVCWHCGKLNGRCPAVCVVTTLEFCQTLSMCECGLTCQC